MPTNSIKDKGLAALTTNPSDYTYKSKFTDNSLLNQLSFDQCRRKLRRELFKIRQSDRDYSEIRLTHDAKLLDAMLVAEGYELPYQTEWGKRRGADAILDRAIRHPQQATAEYFSVGV